MPATCEKCQDRSLRIQALERVLRKVKSGADAFNWVAHEIGMRKSIDEKIRKNHILKQDLEAYSKAIDFLREELGRREDSLARRRATIKSQDETIRLLKAERPRTEESQGFLSRLIGAWRS